MTSFKPLQITEIEIITTMMQDFYAIDNYPIDIQVSKKLFEEFIPNENLGKAYLIYNDSEIIGYAILTFVFSFEYKGKIAFLDELYIKEAFRGKGIGKQTMDFIKTESHKLSLKLLLLEVENHNQNAQKLYLANDFEVHNRKLMKYKL
ncbi:GNAT family N-acetyltransferase [Flavobacterium sp.]|uniref:GNAT family N-acetyltransferase n=1 Tax=Flavobacterium sp. TaxID=239 RepID=UPI00286E7989|nr:GNAT family N-acetyltransferase [Flavobacterium sp.]